MKSVGKSNDGRQIYLLWTTTEDSKLVQVEALKNTTNEAYWVPKLGFTGNLGTSLFEEKSGAYYAEKQKLLNKEQSLEKSKRNLELTK